MLKRERLEDQIGEEGTYREQNADEYSTQFFFPLTNLSNTSLYPARRSASDILIHFSWRRIFLGSVGAAIFLESSPVTDELDTKVHNVLPALLRLHLKRY
jgi:hypothetical protein